MQSAFQSLSSPVPVDHFASFHKANFVSNLLIILTWPSEQGKVFIWKGANYFLTLPGDVWKGISM